MHSPAARLNAINMIKRHESRSSTAGAAAAASPTTTTLQFFSYILRILTSGHGFECVSEEALAVIVVIAIAAS